MNTPDTGYATLGDAYADSLAQSGVTFADDVVNQAGTSGTNSSDPYSIPWTEEHEKRKRLHDAQIQRDNLLQAMGDNPTMEDIVAWSEYDATIKQLTEELGLGPKEYTPGVEGGGYGLDDEVQEEDPQTAEGYYYIESIRQYYFDKANSNISDEEFNKKYPAGILDEWTVGLGKTIGWEACQKYIDSLSQIEKANEESTDEPYTIYSNPEETSNENDSGLGEAFMNDVINREEEKGGIETIKQSLESLLKYANDNENSDLSHYAQKMLDMIKQNGGFSDTAAWYQKKPDLTGNPVYVEDIDGTHIEMETLNEWRIHEFGGDGTQLQRIIDDVKTLVWPPEGGLVNTVLGAIVGELEDYYNPGQLLQDGDVRITVQTPEQTGGMSLSHHFNRKKLKRLTI